MEYLRKKDNKNGFTLVELLVVIAILSLLATSLMANLQLVRQKVRDVRRLEDVNSLITALQFYYDAEGHFPCPVGYTANLPSALSELVTRGYLDRIPQDPSTGLYYYTSLHNIPNPSPPAPPSPCGQIFHLDIDFEKNTSLCPFGKNKLGNPTHCHIYYPTGIPTNFPPPDNCNDPYNEGSYGQPCKNFEDV